jgi:hypothetical protein
MDPKALGRIERKNYIIGGLLIVLAALFGTFEQALGMVFGVVLSALNFSAIRRLIERMLAAAEDQRARIMGWFVPKMGLLMAAVAAVLYFLPVDPVAFAVGFSVFLASVAIESARFMRAQPQGDSDSSSDESESA